MIARSVVTILRFTSEALKPICRKEFLEKKKPHSFAALGIDEPTSSGPAMLCLVASALAFRPVHVCQLTPSTSSAAMRTPREWKLGGGIAQGLGVGKEKNKWVTPVTALALAGVFTGSVVLRAASTHSAVSRTVDTP